MKVAYTKILKVAFILCYFLQSKLDASLLKKDTFEPLQGFAEDYLSPRVTAATLASGFLMNSKQTIGTRVYPKIDLVFILDSSSSVGERNFAKIQQFVRSLVREFKVNPSATQVSVVSFGSNARLEFPLNQHVNIECTIKAIDSLRYIGKKPSLVKALELVSRKVFRKEKGARENAEKIMFLITGEQRNSRETSFKLPDGLFYIISVGGPYSDPYLLVLASSPINSHFLRVKTFDNLEAISEDIRGKGGRRDCIGSATVYDECNRRCTCKNGEVVECYRVRKDFTSMTIKERIRYINTLKVVSSQQPFKEDYDKLTKIHPDYFWEIHVLKFFFPWHRWYILQFENLLRKVDCRVTVPYWDWTRAVSGNFIFRQSHFRDIWHPGPHGLGGNGTASDHCVEKGPFSRRKWKMSSWLPYNCLRRNFRTNPNLTESSYVNALFQLSQKKFKCFEYAIRLYIHNDLHNAVGGTMSVKESVSAPEFWFHHGYLDKLWAKWQNRGPSFKFQIYNNDKLKMPGSDVYRMPYVDLDKQPGCVKVTYKESKNFYNNDISRRSLTANGEDIASVNEKKLIQRTKRSTTFPQLQDFDIDGDYIPPEVKILKTQKDEIDENAKLRKFCNMNIDGSFNFDQSDSIAPMEVEQYQNSML